MAIVDKPKCLEEAWATIDLLEQGGSPTAPSIALAGSRGFLLSGETVAPDHCVWVVLCRKLLLGVVRGRPKPGLHKLRSVALPLRSRPKCGTLAASLDNNL